MKNVLNLFLLAFSTLMLSSCDPFLGTEDTYCMFYVINDTERNLNVRWLHYNTAVTDEEYVIEQDDTLCIHDRFIYSRKESEHYNWDRTNEAVFEACITFDEQESCFQVSDGDKVLVKWQKQNPDNNLFFSIEAWEYKPAAIFYNKYKRTKFERCWYFHITEDMLTKE